MTDGPASAGGTTSDQQGANVVGEVVEDGQATAATTGAAEEQRDRDVKKAFFIIFISLKKVFMCVNFLTFRL